MDRLRNLILGGLRTAWSSGSGWLLADRVIRIVLGVAVNIALARALGPGDFGLLATALSLAALFVPLSTLGCERIVVRELARDASAEGAVLASLGLARLLGGLAGWGLAVAAAALAFGEASSRGMALVAVVGFGNVLLAFDLIDWSFQARGNFRSTTLARLGAFVAGAAVKLALLAAGAGVQALAWAFLLEIALMAFGQVLVRRQAGGAPAAWRWDAAILRGLLLAGFPLLLAEVAVWLFQRLDLVILTEMGGGAVAGTYSAAQRIAQVGYFLPVLVVQVLSPQVARAASDADGLAVVQRAMDGLVIAGLLLAGLLSLGAAPLVRLMFGASYAESATVLSLLAWNNVFVFMGCAHSLFLVNRGRQTLSLGLTWIAATVSVVLNLLLIPRFQALGAAIASVGSYALSTIFGVACFAGSRPLLAVNLRALAAPLRYSVALIRTGRGPSP